MVDSGNMARPNIDTYYYSVISLCSMRTVVFIYGLNIIDTHTGDISNAYLNTCTTEKVVFNNRT